MDEVDVVSVHGVGGLLGVIALPTLRQDEHGLITGDSIEAAQCLG